MVGEPLHRVPVAAHLNVPPGRDGRELLAVIEHTVADRAELDALRCGVGTGDGQELVNFGHGAAMIGKITDLVNGQLTGTVPRACRSAYRSMLQDVVRRIEKRLKAVGKSATAASKDAGLSEDAIRNMRRAVQKGDRQGISTRTVFALAPVLKTTAGWLLEGIGDEEAEEPVRRTVPLVGYVGAGAEAHFYGEGQGPLDQVDAPDGSTEHTKAVEIRGDSLGSFFDRWLVFYDDVRRPVTPDLFNKLCVVGLPNGQVLVKKLQRGSRRSRFHLIGQFGDPILDAEVEWAARVKNMVPR